MRSFITTMVIILLAGGMLSAQQTIRRPDVISYQGMITSSDGSPVADGEYPVTVTLYGDEGGNLEVWQDTYMTAIRGGVFSLYLGSGSIALPAPSQMDRSLWIGIRIAGGDEMRPLTRLSSSPYAINVPDNAITTSKLADGAVTADKVDLDYISGVSVNGKKIEIDGRVLNIKGSNGIDVQYDDMTQSIVIGTPASRQEDKKGDRELQTAPFDAWRAQGDKVDVLNGTTTAATSTDWIGTSAFADFNMRVNNARFMSYQPRVAGRTANVVGGYSGNSVGPNAVGNVIAGGGEPGAVNAITGDGFNVISGGLTNSILNTGSFGSVIAGGQNNQIGTAAILVHYGTISGGFQNRLTGILGTIAGGRSNSVSVEYGSVGGGIGNIINGWIGTIAGGDGNEAHATKAAIGGGYRNKIFSNGNHATIAGGFTNNIYGEYGVIGGGLTNIILNTGSFGGTIAGGQNNQIGTAAISANYGSIGGGLLNQVTATYGTIAGGRSSTVSAVHGSVGGGIGNIIGSAAPLGTIAGGDGNQVHTANAAIGGGYHNQIVGNGYAAAIPGGENLVAQSYGQTVVGVFNIPSGNISPGSFPNDEPIFIVGNGIQNFQSNAFEVSYNGHSTVFHNTFGATPVILGSTYTDNVIYAWGSIDPSGNPICRSFGVVNVQHINRGWYEITMDIVDPSGHPMPINCGSVTATIASQNGPGGGWFSNAIISVSQIVNNVFDVYILDPSGNPVDEAFMFKVTGRP